MGKVFWTKDGEQFDKTRIGCMSGIFHALDYQYWHSNVKKILPHKHAKYNRRYKRISDDEDPLEVLRFLDHETSHILVDQSQKKTNSTQKRSLKSRIKALVSEGDPFKDDNDNERDPNIVPSPRLQRTNSIHHLETNEWVHPIIFFPENVTRSPVISSKRHSHDSIPEIKDSQDILEMLEVDKDLFVNILQDGSQVSDTKAKLTKSGSFPTTYKSGGGNFRPVKLEDKTNDKRLDTPAARFRSSDKGGKNSNSQDDFRDNNVIRIRRVCSLNESADRYAQLFDFSIGKEASLQPSRSLKITSRNESLLSGQEPSFFRRNHSLPLLDDPNQEFRETTFRRNQVSFPLQTEVMDKSDRFLDNELLLTDNVKSNSPALGEDEEKVQPKIQISEDFELLSNSRENLEKEIKNVNGKKSMESSMRLYQDDDDFTYVKQILERSGFIKNGFEQTWYSPNQLLDPFVFQEIESQYFHDPEHFAEDFNELSHRLLVFELVDDVLVSMYERSLTYYPKALSLSCHICPTPTGPRVLDEVWKRVSRLLDLKPDMDESLNYIVAHDLGSDDGWMNLQLDSECVALDLEDLILDDVLEEVLFECS